LPLPFDIIVCAPFHFLHKVQRDAVHSTDFRNLKAPRHNKLRIFQRHRYSVRLHAAFKQQRSMMIYKAAVQFCDFRLCKFALFLIQPFRNFNCHARHHALPE